MRVTIVGANGVIGSHLVKIFEQMGNEVLSTDRDYCIKEHFDYGVVIYCAGITTNYQRYATVQAHVTHLNEWLEKAIFSKIIYLSSTRIYDGLREGTEECTEFLIRAGDFYNQTKLLGESLLLVSSRPYIIVRPSNILAFTPTAKTFFWTVLQMALSGAIELRESAEMARDYVSLEDLGKCIVCLVLGDQQGIFNVCSGESVSNRDVIGIVQEFFPQPSVKYGEKYTPFPCISNRRITEYCQMEITDPRQQMRVLCESFMNIKRKRDD